MNLVSDFCLHCGLSEDGLDISVGNANPSFSEMVTDLAMRANSVFSSVHDNEFYHMISALTGERYHKSEKDVFLSAAQRRAILGHYQTSNAQLREQFFPELRSNEDIFSPIKETTYAQSINTESALLAELIFGLYKRYGPLKRIKKRKAATRLAT